MEKMQDPVIIKKRNGLMIGVSIIEILIGIIWAVAGEGFKTPALWIFGFVGIITALTVFAEYSQDIFLRENEMEFYKNNDLIKEVKYSSIKSISIRKGKEPKNSKKDFVSIDYAESNKKNSKKDSYLLNPMSYSAQDLIKIKDTILSKNPSVKVNEEVDKFFK